MLSTPVRLLVGAHPPEPSQTATTLTVTLPSILDHLCPECLAHFATVRQLLDELDLRNHAFNAIEADPNNADAHYNLAGIYERRGEKQAALRHLKSYRALTA